MREKFKPKLRLRYAWAIIALCWTVTASGQWMEKLSTRGYVKDLRVVAIDATGVTLQQNLIHNRLNFGYEFKPRWHGGLELRNRVFYGEFLKHVNGYGDLLEKDPGFIDMSWSWINNPALVAHTAIDRLWLNYTDSKWDVRLGRQRLNWGINTVWNPNDLFNVLNFADFDYEERPGSDALKVERYLKRGGSLQAAYKLSRETDETVAGLLYRFNYRQYDIQTLLARYRDDLAVGGGWAGNLKGTGFKGEFTWFEPLTDSSERSLLTSVAVDFIIPKGPYMNLSLLYNSLGTSDLNRLLLLSPAAGGTLDVKNLMPNKLSGFVQMGGPVSPLFSLNMAAILAIDMNGYFLMPAMEYSVKTNLDMSLIGQSFVGKTTKWQNLSSAIFLRFKWSF